MPFGYTNKLLCLLMIAIKISIYIFILVFIAGSAFACERPSYGSKVISNLIEVEVNEKDQSNFFHISIPYELKGMVLNTASLEYGCADEKNNFSFIPLALRREGEFMETEVLMNFKENKNWKVHVTYLKERQEQDLIVFDGPAIESWQALKHNKNKNVKASKADSDALNARSF